MKIYLQNETRGYGQIIVDQYNVSGRVCNTFWDNDDAKMFCKDRGHNDGAAYHYTIDMAWWRDRGRIPYFMSSVNCSGTESKFSDCDFNTRLDLGNCSTANAAGVICFNDSGNLTVNCNRKKWTTANGSLKCINLFLTMPSLYLS